MMAKQVVVSKLWLGSKIEKQNLAHWTLERQMSSIPSLLTNGIGAKTPSLAKI